jgi:hypothetical protein
LPPKSAPVIQVLLRSPGIKVMSFSQADAYQRRFPFLTKLTFPQGVADLVRDFPAGGCDGAGADRQPDRPRRPPSGAAESAAAGGQRGAWQIRLLPEAGEFPAYKDHMVPLSPEAARYFKSGPLPAALPAVLAGGAGRPPDRLLIPIIALLIPLLKVAPAVYNWRVRSKVFPQCYGELKFLEDDLRHHFDPAKLGDYRNRLDALDEEASLLRVPLGFTDLVYTLREHVNLVRHAVSGSEKLGFGMQRFLLQLA